MIKAEVVFDGDVVLINGHSIFVNCEAGELWIEIDEIQHHDLNLEQAVAYCLGN